jgi:uncharacterized protein involved in response to NO
MSLLTHPLWRVGFRPFFLLGMLAGAVLPVGWALVFGGHAGLAASPVDPLRWHAHEMFYGFGWAILGGFLLTATKNWVNVRGHHGGRLLFLALAWLLERATLLLGDGWPVALRLLGEQLFLGSIVVLLLWTLIRHRDQDSYRDNLFFIVLLPVFIVAKTLLLHGDFTAGTTMTLALFRLAFLVMLERTLTQFMRAAFQVEIRRDARLDMPIKGLGLLLVAAPWLPAGLVAGLALALGVLLLIRLPSWQPLRALHRIDIGIMFVGYLAIAGQLLLFAWEYFAGPAWVGTLPTHLFTFGAMGCVIPAMIVRIAKGHTGRKVSFDAADRGVLYLMLAALAIRTLLPQLAPAHYLLWIDAAAAGWLLAFGLLAWRYVPLLLAPRIDGREH